MQITCQSAPCSNIAKLGCELLKVFRAFIVISTLMRKRDALANHLMIFRHVPVWREAMIKMFFLRRS